MPEEPIESRILELLLHAEESLQTAENLLSTMDWANMVPDQMYKRETILNVALRPIKQMATKSVSESPVTLSGDQRFVELTDFEWRKNLKILNQCLTAAVSRFHEDDVANNQKSILLSYIENVAERLRRSADMAKAAAQTWFAL